MLPIKSHVSLAVFNKAADEYCPLIFLLESVDNNVTPDPGVIDTVPLPSLIIATSVLIGKGTDALLGIVKVIADELLTFNILFLLFMFKVTELVIVSLTISM
jgi:hypothetical protein